MQYKDDALRSATPAEVQGPVALPSPRELQAFHGCAPDDQLLSLGHIIARAVVLFADNNDARRFRRLLQRALRNQDEAQRVRGFTISRRAYVIDAMPAPGVLLRLVVRRQSADMLLVACDPQRLAAFGVAPLPLLADAGDGPRTGSLSGGWWGTADALLDWLARLSAERLSVMLRTGEMLTIRATMRGLGLAVDRAGTLLGAEAGTISMKRGAGRLLEPARGGFGSSLKPEATNDVRVR